MKTKQTIKNKTQFENVIATYATLAAKAARLKDQKKAVDEQLKETEAAMAEEKAAAEAYALAHENEVLSPGKKSGETSMATYGFKAPKPTLEPEGGKWDAVVDAILAKPRAWAKKYLAIKHTPDKNALKTLDEAKLAELGLSFKTGSGFYISPKS